MTKAQQLLLDRRAELEAEIKAQTAPLQAEIADIDRALAAMTREGAAAPKAPKINVRVRWRDDAEVPKSINKQAMAVLEQAEKGLETSEIANCIRDVFEREVNGQSLSWYLSHLKKDKKIEQVDKRWILPRFLNTKAAG